MTEDDFWKTLIAAKPISPSHLRRSYSELIAAVFLMAYKLRQTVSDEPDWGCSVFDGGDNSQIEANLDLSQAEAPVEHQDRTAPRRDPFGRAPGVYPNRRTRLPR